MRSAWLFCFQACSISARLFAAMAGQLEGADQLLLLTGLFPHRFGGSCCFQQRDILLRGCIHRGDRPIDLVDAGTLAFTGQLDSRQLAVTTYWCRICYSHYPFQY